MEKNGANLCEKTRQQLELKFIKIKPFQTKVLNNKIFCSQSSK